MSSSRWWYTGGIRGLEEGENDHCKALCRLTLIVRWRLPPGGDNIVDEISDPHRDNRCCSIPSAVTYLTPDTWQSDAAMMAATWHSLLINRVTLIWPLHWCDHFTKKVFSEPPCDSPIQLGWSEISWATDLTGLRFHPREVVAEIFYEERMSELWFHWEILPFPTLRFSNISLDNSWARIQWVHCRC